LKFSGALGPSLRHHGGASTSGELRQEKDELTSPDQLPCEWLNFEHHKKALLSREERWKFRKWM
jgi:hypothetical protein